MMTMKPVPGRDLKGVLARGKEKRAKKEINARKAKQYYKPNESDRPLFFILWNTIGTLRTVASSLGSYSLVCANYV